MVLDSFSFISFWLRAHTTKTCIHTDWHMHTEMWHIFVLCVISHFTLQLCVCTAVQYPLLQHFSRRAWTLQLGVNHLDMDEEMKHRQRLDRGHGCLDVWSKPEKLTLLHVKLGHHLVGKSTEYSRWQAEMC